MLCFCLQPYLFQALEQQGCNGFSCPETKQERAKLHRLRSHWKPFGSLGLLTQNETLISLQHSKDEKRNPMQPLKFAFLNLWRINVGKNIIEFFLGSVTFSTFFTLVKPS